MYYKISLILWVVFSSISAQENKIEWEPDYEFELNDFQGSETSINQNLSKFYVQSGVIIDISFQMSNIEFMFTKNFNSKITCIFDKNAATIVASDSLHAKELVRLVNFDFDLAELYARKIRKELNVNKRMFSDVSFFKPYYDKMIAERNEMSSRTLIKTDFGNNSSLLQHEHELIKKKIHELADYCKTCKPPKRRKNR